MRILVVGDAMVDRYYIGGILRLNPEAKHVPLLSVGKVLSIDGGASNVARNLRAMGATVDMACQKSGAIVKNRLLDEEDGVVARFDEEQELVPIDVHGLGKELLAPLRYVAVVVSDYGKGAIDGLVAEAVRALHLPTFVDCKVRPDRWIEWAEAMFPNEREFVAHRAEYVKAKTCVVKCGAKGARVYENGSLVLMKPSRAKHVRNVAGAGDTFVAAFVLASLAIARIRLRGGSENPGLDVPLSMALEFAASAVADPLTAAPSFLEVYGDAIGYYYARIAEEIGK